MAKIDRDIDQETTIWNARMVDVMFSLVHGDKLEINCDDFAAACRAIQVPPHLLRKAIPCLFKSFKNQGYIKRVNGKAVISDRSGKLIAVYQCVKTINKARKSL